MIFASCDDRFFEKFAIPFCSSCSQNGFDVHINIINPTMSSHMISRYIKNACKTRITFSSERINIDGLNTLQKKSLYACSRFLLLPEMIRSAKKVVVLDIDSLVVNRFEFPTKSVGFFPRFEEKMMSKKVAAGVTYFTEKSLPLAKVVSKNIKRQISQKGYYWGMDQRAMYHAFKEVDLSESHIFDNTFMDWEFSDDTFVWTGKGPRKWNNEKYLKKIDYFISSINK